MIRLQIGALVKNNSNRIETDALIIGPKFWWGIKVKDYQRHFE